MKHGKISIVVPVYNVEDYLERCIESLLGQTYRNIEIILIDDGSDDASKEICDRYAAADNRVIALHKENGGVVSARRAGAGLATGDYVCSVDGDDWIEADRILRFAERAAETDADMVYMEGYYKDYTNRSVLVETCVEDRLYSGNEVMERVFPMLIDTSSCFRRQIRAMQVCWGIRRGLFRSMWDQIDDRVSMGEDYAHIILCLMEAETVCLMRERGYHYVMRESSASHTLNKASLEGVKLWFQLVKEQMDAHGCRDEWNLHMVFLKMWYIMNCDYSILLEKPRRFLYPYPQVKKGSRVAVYGAGTVGVQLVKIIDRSEDYELACWADSYSGGRMLEGHMVQGMQELLEAEFDHVAIAVLDRDIVDEIERSLLECGIPVEKIATMDAGVISGEELPEGF